MYDIKPEIIELTGNKQKDNNTCVRGWGTQNICNNGAGS